MAVTILIIGVIGPLSLAARGISDGLFAQNQLTASFLAQEAIEVIINQRNSNVSDILAVGDAFFDILPSGQTGDDKVGVDPVSGVISHDCPAAGCYLNNVGGFYQESPSGQFLRKISLSKSGDELKVDVQITWYNKTVRQDFSVTEYLYGK